MQMRHISLWGSLSNCSLFGGSVSFVMSRENGLFTMCALHVIYSTDTPLTDGECQGSAFLHESSFAFFFLFCLCCFVGHHKSHEKIDKKVVNARNSFSSSLPSLARSAHPLSHAELFHRSRRLFPQCVSALFLHKSFSHGMGRRGWVAHQFVEALNN